MRRRYIYFLLTYFHNSSKKEHITLYSIKSTINSTEAANLPGPSCFSETGIIMPILWSSVLLQRYGSLDTGCVHKEADFHGSYFL